MLTIANCDGIRWVASLKVTRLLCHAHVAQQRGHVGFASIKKDRSVLYICYHLN